MMPPITFTATTDPYAVNREAELDLIIGRMVRRLIEFEGRVCDAQTLATIEAVKDEAYQEAERRGLGAQTFWKVASKIGFTR